MDIYEKAKKFMSGYKKDEIIFYSVLQRHFHELADHIGNYLTEKGYVKSAVLYRCPYCRRTVCILQDNEQPEDELVCYACDKTFDLSEFEGEPVWICK